jgi:hypothetical protein
VPRQTSPAPVGAVNTAAVRGNQGVACAGQIGAYLARSVGVRVLVSGVPGLGHLVPVLDLAGALQLAGHEVRVATNKESTR